MTHSRRRAVALAAAAMLLISIIGAATACDDAADDAAIPTAAPTLAPGQTPPPSRTPTAAPADADVGARLRYEGDLDGAIAVYAAVAREKEGVEAQDARFAQAQLLAEQSRYAEARDVLATYVAAPERAQDDSDGNLGTYMLASALDEVGDEQDAYDAYSRYVDAAGILSQYANIERAKMLARLGRGEGAATLAEAAMADPTLLVNLKQSLLTSMAASFEEGHDDARALEWYGRARQQGGGSALAIAGSGAIKQRLGDPAWVDDDRAVIDGYPESQQARDALAALDAAGIAVGDYARGLVQYRGSEYDAASRSFGAAVLNADHPGEAAYYLGAMAEGSGDAAGAIDRYAQSYLLDPASPLAADALWWRARLLGAQGRYDEAAGVFGQLTEAFPGSDRAADAAFNHAVMLYRAGDSATAASAFKLIAATAQDDEDKARARFWQGRAQRDADAATAEATWRALIDDQPQSFYALRAGVLLDDNAGDGDVDLDDGKIDWGKIEDYIGQYASSDTYPPLRPGGEHLADMAQALERVGLHSQAVAVWELRIFDDDELSPEYLLDTTRTLYDAGETSLASRAATVLLHNLHDIGAADPPRDLKRVAYPLPYKDLLDDAAKDQDLPPLLLAALVRQESFYDPRAGSTAGALGLTQVIEPTGRAIAAELDAGPFEAGDLFKPAVSLRFGAHYLAGQINAFEGNLYHALAAYNGGPGAPEKAFESATVDDVDLFVQDLEFRETRDYVRRVMEHYAMYRSIYEDGVDRPSLPQ